MGKGNTPRDQDNQPLNKSLNYKKNLNKAAAALRGIITGLTADRQLKDIEIFFLQNWLENQEDKKADILDIYEEVTSILKDGIITKEEISELMDLIDDCIEYGKKMDDDDSRINQFIGFLMGISADDEINEVEFEKLRIEIQNNTDILHKWPFQLVINEITKITHDGFVDRSELNELCNLLKEITGTNFTQDGCAIGGATTLFEDVVHSIEGKFVCATGKFICGTRKNVESLIIEMGGIPQDSVTEKTDVVLIGTLSSKDWIHSSTGRKIERAIYFKDKGQQISITSERVVFKVAT